MATGQRTTWHAAVAWIGTIYFVAVTAFICPGMQTATHRYGPHLVFEDAMPAMDPTMQMQAAGEIAAADTGAIDPAMHHQHSRQPSGAMPAQQMTGPLMIRLGAGLPPLTVGIMLALETFLTQALYILQGGSLRATPLRHASYTPSPVWLPTPHRPPISCPAYDIVVSSL